MKFTILMELSRYCSGCCCILKIVSMLDMLFCIPFAGYVMGQFAGSKTSIEQEGVFLALFITHVATSFLLGFLVPAIMRLPYRSQIKILMTQRFFSVIFLVFTMASPDMDRTKEIITSFIGAFFMIHVVIHAMLITFGNADSKYKRDQRVAIDCAKPWIPAALISIIPSIFMKFMLSDATLTIIYYFIYTFGFEALAASAYFVTIPDMFYENEDDTKSDETKASLQSTA